MKKEVTKELLSLLSKNELIQIQLESNRVIALLEDKIKELETERDNGDKK